MHRWLRSLLFCTCLFFYFLDGYPDRFRRLLLLDNNNIAKVVDIISDSHAALYQPVKGVRKSVKKYLSKEEIKNFTSSERVLMAAFNKLNEKTKEPIKLLWEFDPINLYIKNLFISYAGNQLSKKFNIDSNQMIVFEAADTFRNIIPAMKFLTSAIYPAEVGLLTVGKLKFYLENILYFEDRYMNLISTHQQDAFQKIINEWQAQRIGILQVQEEIETISDAISIADLLEILKENKKFDSFKKNFNEYIKKEVFNFEVIFKLILSAQRHIIIYAGGQHSDEIADFLIKNLNYTPIIDIGTEKVIKLFLPVLSGAAWDFLLEDPAVSFKRYQKQGAFNKALDKQFWYNEVAPFIDKVKMGNLDPKELEALKQQLSNIIKKGFNDFIDIINTQESNSRETFAHIFIKKNNPALLKILLRHAPNLSIQNRDYKTPLDYARKRKNPDIMFLLKEHTYIK